MFSRSLTAETERIRPIPDCSFAVRWLEEADKFGGAL